ncbi:MAG: sialate O-acetylesterase, partial [Fibrobacter sp.]|nr:sialate O-acetylesterase [Fibrobacter sp.]
MSILKKALFVFSAAALFASQIFAQVDTNFHIYILFGQSNMAGPCNNQNATAQARDPQPRDCDTTNRVKVLAW